MLGKSKREDVTFEDYGAAIIAFVSQTCIDDSRIDYSYGSGNKKIRRTDVLGFPCVLVEEIDSCRERDNGDIPFSFYISDKDDAVSSSFLFEVWLTSYETSGPKPRVLCWESVYLSHSNEEVLERFISLIKLKYM